MDATHRWHSLPESVKARILDEHRYWNVDHHDWWSCVYDDFKEDMANVGISVDEMYFSGFSSQGDGACFEGRVNSWPLFLKSLGYNDDVLIEHFKEVGDLVVKHSGRYYHENCTSFSMEWELPTDPYTDEERFLESYGCGEELRDAVLIARLSQYDSNELKAEFTEAFKDHMRDLYHRLEEEYDHLTSDEAVLESLYVNGQLDDLIAEHTEELEFENE